MGFLDVFSTALPLVKDLFEIGQGAYGIYQDQRDYKQNQSNIDRQFSQVDRAFEANERNLQITRDREDNAIQRRSTDLAAAGLNPLLAVGAPASSSPPIQASQGSGTASHHSSRINAPQLDAAAAILQMKKMNEEIELLKSEKGEIDARATLYEAEAKESLSKVNVNEKMIEYYGQEMAESVALIGELKARKEYYEAEGKLKGAQVNEVNQHIKNLEQQVAESVTRSQGIAIESALNMVRLDVETTKREFTTAFGFESKEGGSGITTNIARLGYSAARGIGKSIEYLYKRIRGGK
jgi:hypothetical protein